MSFTSISLSLCFFLLILLTLSFTEQKFWIKIPAYRYFFHRSSLWYYVTKSDCLTQSLLGFLICYLLWVLQFCNLHLCLYFILVHIWEGCKFLCLDFFFLSSYSSTICWNDCFFNPLYCLCFFAKDQLTIFMWVYFWALYSALYSFISNTLSWLLKLYNSWSWVLSVLQFFLLNITLAILGLLLIHINFRMCVTISTKQLAGISTEFVLNLID